MNISFTDYPIYMKIGHFDREKEFARKVFVSLDIEFPLSVAKFYDDLELTLDYSAVIDLLNKKFAHKSFNLLETLTVVIARELFYEFSTIHSVRVKIEKTLMAKALLKEGSLSVSHLFKAEDFLDLKKKPLEMSLDKEGVS